MTKEEAINELKIFSGTTRIRLSANFWTAHNMAIKALEQEPCEDVISRQVVKDKYEECLVNNLKDNDRGIDLSKYAEKPYKEFCEFMDSIPPVTPAQKTGQWIEIEDQSAVCSCCNRNNILFGDYCKWCGAKMVEPQILKYADTDTMMPAT